jgi:AraC family transcriptional regulator
MANDVWRSANLAAGNFYGKVPQKRSVGSSIMCEVVHRSAVDVPEHSHELAYFTFILGGDYSEKFGVHTFEHQPMTVLWHRAGIVHKDRIGSSGARFFTVEIGRPAIESLSQHSPVPLDFVERGTPLSWVAARLFYEFKNWQRCSELISEGLILEMLGYAARHNADREKHPPEWLLRVVERLNDEFALRISSDEMAATANVHPVYLAAAFRRFYGQTIGEYVQRLRVSRASALMIDTEVPLADIAYQSGFSDQSHLNRIYKRVTGMTPGAFRNSLH